MNIVFALAMYFVLWWLVLFAVLPIGVHTQGEAGEVVPGTESSAPVNPRIGHKALATTIISAALFGGAYALDAFGVINFGNLLFGRP